MANLKSPQTQVTQPLSSPSHPKSDEVHVTLHVPIYNKPQTPQSKCFFYTFLIFFLLCILLFVFTLFFLRPKPLPLLLSSPSLLSLSSNPQSPSFHFSLSSSLHLHNPNFPPFHLKSASLSILHLNQSTGFSNLNKIVVVKGRGDGVVKVNVTAKETNLSDDERNRLRDEMNSGVLGFKAVVRVRGDVVLFNWIRRRAYGGLDCDFSIDLRSQQLLSFFCI